LKRRGHLFRPLRVPLEMLPVYKAVVARMLIAVAAASSPHYNESDAFRFLQYARAAFCSKFAIETWSCGDMCDDTVTMPGWVRHFGPGETCRVQGYVAKVSADYCVVAFRGSVETENWMCDADFKTSPWPPYTSLATASWCPNCKAHSGFARAYAELRSGMIGALRELNCGNAAFAGHSLGAAVAILASFETRVELDLRVGPVYTYGCPRVGDRNFVSAYEAFSAKDSCDPPTWRVVHFHDPVPLLAPRRLLRYQHTSVEILYNREFSEHKVCEAVNGDENPACSLATPTWRFANPDHVTYFNKTLKHKDMPKECIIGRKPALPVGMSEEVIV